MMGTKEDGKVHDNTNSSLNSMNSVELADEAALAGLGYKQEFKREFTLFSTFAVSFSVLGLLPSIASTLVYGMGYAGTAGMTWGWLLAMIGIQSVASSMAELSSSMPTSGGLYYCSAVLAPDGWGPLAAYITGWSNWLGQVTGAPSVNYGNASMLLAAVSMNNPNYIPQTWHVFLVTVCFMFVDACITSMPTKFVARFNSLGTLFNTLIVFIVIIIVPSATTNTDPKFNSNSFAWSTITNGTDWPDGIAVLMSFVSIIWTMSGYDAPFHLSEECSNSQIATPRAIVMTSATGGLLGWAVLLVMAYTVIDIPSVLDSDLGQPYVAWALQVLSLRMANVVVALTVFCGFFMGQACMLAASRLTFAYARDGQFPMSKLWAAVNKTTKTPVNAVWFNFVIGTALLCLMFAGPVAIGAIFSVGAIAAYFAFTVPIALKLISPAKFKPGPWHLGKMSVPVGLIASGYVLLMIPILLLPSVRGSDLDPTSMNWTVVVWAGPLLLALIYYPFSGFKGPRINIDHLELPNGEVVTPKGLRTTVSVQPVADEV